MHFTTNLWLVRTSRTLVVILCHSPTPPTFTTHALWAILGKFIGVVGCERFFCAVKNISLSVCFKAPKGWRMTKMMDIFFQMNRHPMTVSQQSSICRLTATTPHYRRGTSGQGRPRCLPLRWPVSLAITRNIRGSVQSTLQTQVLKSKILWLENVGGIQDCFTRQTKMILER